MSLLKFAFVVLLILFVVSALFGLVGFLVDIVRYPQKHEKVKIISSFDTPDSSELTELDDGLVLDESIIIFGGDKSESST